MKKIHYFFTWPHHMSTLYFAINCLQKMVSMNYCTVFFTFILFVSNPSIADVNFTLADPQIQSLLIEAESQLKNSPEDSLKLAKNILNMGKEKQDIGIQVYGLIMLGHVMEATNKDKTAGRYYLRAMNLEHNEPTLSSDHNLMFFLSDGLRVIHRYTEAQRYLEKGISLQLQKGDDAYLMHAYDLQSSLYSEQKMYNKAIESSQTSLLYARDIQSETFILRAYRKIAQSSKKLGDYNTSKEYNEKALEIVKTSGNSQKIAQYLEYVSTDQRALGLYASALENAQHALTIQRNYNDTYRISNLLLNLSIIYLKLSSYDRSLSYALELLSIHEGSGDLNRIASASNQVGLIYSRLKRFDDAAYYHERTLSLNPQVVDERYQASALRSLADIKLEVLEYATSLAYAEKARNLYQKINDERGLATVDYTTAKIYTNLDNNQKAVKSLESAIHLSSELDDKWNEARSWVYMGEVLAEKDSEKSRASLEKGITIAKILNAKSILLDAYRILLNIERSHNNLDIALHYYDIVSNLVQEIDNKEIDDRIAELKIVQETEKQEREIERLKRNVIIRELELSKQASALEISNNKNTISALELERERSKLITLIGFTFIIVLILAFVYMRYRYLKESQNILNNHNIEVEKRNHSLAELNLTKDRFFSIISHDLRTPIASIVALSDTLNEHFDDYPIEKIKKYVNNISKASDQTFSLLENLLSWATIQMRDSDPLPQHHKIHDICLLAIHQIDTAATAKDISIEYTVDTMVTIYADKNMIATVIRNLLTNAIKFTPAQGSICVYSHTLEDSVTVHIKDYGTGISDNDQKYIFNLDGHASRKGTYGEAGTGLGLALCKSLVEKNAGTLSFHSKEGEGSEFFFTLPKKPH